MTDSLIKAKTGLLLSQPFFASLAMKTEYDEDSTIPTASTNGLRIRYNPEFFDSLSYDERIGVLAHEVMHTALSHHTRRGSRDAKGWNIACDYSINSVLTKSGIFLPKDALLDSKYDGMSPEAIYATFPAGNNPGWKPGDGFDGGMGDIEDFPDPDLAPQEEQEQQMRLVEAYTAARLAGQSTGALDELITQILHPKENWYDVLERILSEKARDDYSWLKPNRAYLNRGLYVPGLENRKYGEVVLIVDTSLSMSQEQLDEAASRVSLIHEITSNTVHVVYVDTKVKGSEVFEPGDLVKLHAKGGGGTDFVPGFNWIDQQGLEPKLVIYFTDGYCNNFAKDPGYEVIWCINNTHNFNPPYGEVVRM